MLRRRSKLFYFLLTLLCILGIILFVLSYPELSYKNEGTSKSYKTVSNGSLENAYLFPYRGSNFKYFSCISYYLMNNAYVHSKVYLTVLDSYKELESTAPNYTFQIMECSDKEGGKLRLHRTHQNGKSIDFMVPKKGKGIQFNNIGLLHYLLDFDKEGRLLKNKKSEIDFELMAKHILSLQKAGIKHGVEIKKVILKINLKDDLWKTKSGKKLKSSGIYFA